ncbi:hypothetical protein ALC57_13975 [Trachymyrmex cornetzi]|uniref:Uncharacterized protein n=1 Tax=Trachymyrmex cornetzi TaxID=471704 RepID=A0A195DM35_9HYME|nr:hypothetical protein ALC57_13975 [Trachymyrmex cornetzi]
MEERQMQRKKENGVRMNRVRVKEKEKLLESYEKDKERKLGKREEGRAIERGKETEREGLVDPARYQEPPLPVAPISTPTLYTPPCIQRVHAFVCAVVKTHTTLTWLVPRRSWAQSDAAWRRRREVVPALTL